MNFAGILRTFGMGDKFQGQQNRAVPIATPNDRSMKVETVRETVNQKPNVMEENKKENKKENTITENIGKYTFIGGLVGTVTIGGVKILGFMKSGILAGTYATSMMSSAAIANGGAVSAGSTVAILQSIGATVSATYFLPVVVVGGCVYGGAKYYKNSKTEKQNNETNKINKE